MRSFRLYVGERSDLTAAGWVSLAFAASVTSAVGYLGAAWLTDQFGPGSVWKVVAACGVATWLLALGCFRAAGLPLIARLPDTDPSDEPE